MKVHNYHLAICIDWIYKKTPFLNSFKVVYYSGLDGLFMEIIKRIKEK